MTAAAKVEVEITDQMVHRIRRGVIGDGEREAIEAVADDMVAPFRERIAELESECARLRLLGEADAREEVRSDARIHELEARLREANALVEARTVEMSDANRRALNAEAQLEQTRVPPRTCNGSDALTAEDVLRDIACYVSAGGYNAETVDPETFRRKIRDGIDHEVDFWRKRAEAAERARFAEPSQFVNASPADELRPHDRHGMVEESKPVQPGVERGDRVRLPDGREGKLCWVTAGGEAAVAVDGEQGTFHLRAADLVPAEPAQPVGLRTAREYQTIESARARLSDTHAVLADLSAAVRELAPAVDPVREVLAALENLLAAAREDVKDSADCRDHEEGRVAGIRQCIRIVKHHERERGCEVCGEDDSIVAGVCSSECAEKTGGPYPETAAEPAQPVDREQAYALVEAEVRATGIEVRYDGEAECCWHSDSGHSTDTLRELVDALRKPSPCASLRGAPAPGLRQVDAANARAEAVYVLLEAERKAHAEKSAKLRRVQAVLTEIGDDPPDSGRGAKYWGAQLERALAAQTEARGR